MKLQTEISDASYKKIISYKAHLEQDGNKKTMSETVDAFIQNSKVMTVMEV